MLPYGLDAPGPEQGYPESHKLREQASGFGFQASGNAYFMPAALTKGKT